MFFLPTGLLAFACLSWFAFAANLPTHELEALQVIARTFGKTGLNFSGDPCSDNLGVVTCDCSFANNTVCHVISIHLTSNNLTGELPASLGRLTALKELRIGDSNFTESIPGFILNWTHVAKISIQASDLSGPIPSGIAPLTNLTTIFARSEEDELSRLKSFHYRRILRSSDGVISRKTRIGILHGVGAFVILLLVGALLWWAGCFRRKVTLEHELKGVDLQTGSFTLRQIKAATNNFDPANKVGEGGFGLVYKGTLSDGTAIAVKQLSSKSKQGHREFVTEIGMISALVHPHLVKLYGCCIDGNQLLLIYEYMEKNCLARALFGPEEHQLNLDWPTRYKICIGVAKGLVYLHEESTLKIVHRDIKASNVLLDGNLFPKISDFGIARLNEEDGTHISTRIAGTYGYMAPEYAMRGYLTDKADVYSFGVVLLEVVAGRSNIVTKMQDGFNLVDWANSLNRSGNLMELVDPTLKLNGKKEAEQVLTTIEVAVLCTNFVPTDRPSMSTALSMLEGRAVAQGENSSETTNVEQATEFSNIERESLSTDALWTGTSTSSVDLYPIAIDTEFWKKRVE